MINNITNIHHPNYNIYTNVERTVLSNTGKNKPCNSYGINVSDTVSFSGLRVNQAHSSKEIKEIVNLFYESLRHNIEPNKKPMFFDKILRKILTYPFIVAAKQPTSVTEVVKSGDKLVGGYSLNLDIGSSTSHLNFMTLAPDAMKTGTGAEALKLIAKRICQILENAGIKEMTWSTNANNKPINNLLKRLNPEKKQVFLSETKYKISLEQLKFHTTTLRYRTPNLSENPQ